VKPARHPYRVTSARQLEPAEIEHHIGDLVRLVLLTAPGERLHRRDFGAGLGTSALFEPLDPALLTMVQARARGSLEQSLGDRIDVVSIDVDVDGESAIIASISYRLRAGDTGRNLHLVVRR